MRVSLSAIVALLGATTVLSHAVMTIPTPRKVITLQCNFFPFTLRSYTD